MKSVFNTDKVRVGCVVGNDSKGYRFIPWNSAHKPSRKAHASPEAAIPRWVGKHRIMNEDDR